LPSGCPSFPPKAVAVFVDVWTSAKSDWCITYDVNGHSSPVPENGCRKVDFCDVYENLCQSEPYSNKN
jgi:hypothetical protein